MIQNLVIIFQWETLVRFFREIVGNLLWIIIFWNIWDLNISYENIWSGWWGRIFGGSFIFYVTLADLDFERPSLLQDFSACTLRGLGQMLIQQSCSFNRLSSKYILRWNSLFWMVTLRKFCGLNSSWYNKKKH